MTNYMGDGTVRATAGRAFAEAKARLPATGNIDFENNPAAWLGRDASWEQRRLFDRTYGELVNEYAAKVTR